VTQIAQVRENVALDPEQVQADVRRQAQVEPVQHRQQAAFERAVSYAQERQAFGKPIGDFQLTRAKLARMATLLTVSRQFTYAVGRLMDQGLGQMEASMVKLFTCRTAEWLTREAMQIHGGMGYAEESPVSRYFLDARVLSIFEGAEETLALKVIARSLIDSV
jgi:(2S)-methylsuccinyl-CoA dehydrogenase